MHSRVIPAVALLISIQSFAQVRVDHEPGGAEPVAEPPAVTNAACAGGRAAGYPCSNVDILAFVPRSQLGAADPETLNDIWGWTDPDSGREYALVGMSNGVAFVDITTPTEPRLIGRLPSRTVNSPWRGVRVYRNYAYVVADRAGSHGVQIFDLRRLRTATPGTIFTADAHYFGSGFSISFGEIVRSAHNVVINEESGYGYIVGARTTCRGGLHMMDLRDPLVPRFAGCFAEDGYTHDAQCVTYRGIDREHDGKEVCLASNEDSVTIVDVSDKGRPRMLSRTQYPGVQYTHQGWLTADQSYFVVNDELDEVRNGTNTRTLIFDVRDLDRPMLIGSYFGPTRSIDHNLFIRDGYVFEANYRSGLRVLDASNVAAGRLTEVGFLDIVPDEEEGFGGAWGNYPFFPSGNVVISGMEQGLYIVRPAVLKRTSQEPSQRRRGVRP